MSEQQTSAGTWRSRGVRNVTLPSGESIRLRRVSREALFMSARLPFALRTKVISTMRAMSGGIAEMSDEKLAEMPEVVNAVIVNSVESPTVVLEGADEEKNEINVADIPDEDRLYIFTAAMDMDAETSLPVAMAEGEVSHEAVATFRDDGRGSVVGGDGEDVRAETEQLAGVAG